MRIGKTDYHLPAVSEMKKEEFISQHGVDSGWIYDELQKEIKNQGLKPTETLKPIKEKPKRDKKKDD